MRGNPGVPQLCRIARSREVDLVAFEKAAQYFAAHRAATYAVDAVRCAHRHPTKGREVDGLRKVAGALGDFQRVELGDDHADDVAGLIDHGAAAVAAPDLHLRWIVADAGDGIRMAEAYRGFGVEHGDGFGGRSGDRT